MKIYIISYKNEERLNRMIKRFEQVEMEKDIVITKEVHIDDERLTSLSNREKYNKIDLRTWSIMLRHMDVIQSFYDSEDEHCIVCEDDIYISKDFSNDLGGIIKDFEEMKWDILLLGYLYPHKHIDLQKIYSRSSYHSYHSYHSYPDNIWGTQMYMISRSYAKFLLDKFDLEHAYETIDTYPYSSDWIITKNGKRALIFPMMAVEEGVNLSGHKGHVEFHKTCFEANYDSNKYI